MWEKYPVIREELAALETYLIEKFPQKGGFLDEVSQKMIKSGGKRIRPVLTILCAMFGTYERQKVFPVAVALETLHTATLVHDDIIDNSETRRGRVSIPAKHGIDLAVYTGDYLLVKSVLLLSEASLPGDKLEGMARALEQMCIGEVEQYIGRKSVPTIRQYLKRIMRKTGILLSSACALGAYSGGCSEEKVKLLGRFGMYFGVIFQIRDDLLDLQSADSGKRIGKPVTRDLREGVVTLPVIYAIRNNDAVRIQLEKLFLGKGGMDKLITNIISAGGAEGAKNLIQRYGQRCLNILRQFPAANSRDALEDTVLWLIEDVV